MRMAELQGIPTAMVGQESRHACTQFGCSALNTHQAARPSHLSGRFPRKMQPGLTFRACLPQLSFRKLRELHAVTDEQDDAQAQDFVETRLTDQVNHIKIVSGAHQQERGTDLDRLPFVHFQALHQ